MSPYLKAAKQDLIQKRLKDIAHKLDYKNLSLNPLLTWDFIQANPDKPWNWIYLSQHPHTTWDIIQCFYNPTSSHERIQDND